MAQEQVPEPRKPRAALDEGLRSVRPTFSGALVVGLIVFLRVDDAARFGHGIPLVKVIPRDADNDP